jgi:probable phosphoglycerate mutase
MPPSVILIRHGETEWSRELRHTGRTDVPLTAAGREQALLAGARLATNELTCVLVSPLQRARDTAELAGLRARAQVVDDLVEVDYGDYEGRTTLEIREERPGWDLWNDGCPNGEPLDAAGARVDRVLERVADLDGEVVLVAHGHILRILTARWIGLEARWGGAFPLQTGAMCRLGHERERRAILRWNATSHLEAH